MRTASLRGPVSGLIPGALFALGLFTVAFAVDPPVVQDFVDLPSREILFGPRLPLTAPSDTRPEVYSKADGQLAVLSQEDHTVKALHSFNSGVTFAPEILVAGGPGGIPVEGYTSASSPEGTIHVVVAIADPLGQVGLQALRSADMGRTWTAPVDILRHGDTLHDIDSNPFVTLRIEAGAGGRVAIFFAKQINGFFYVVSSTDGGASWGAPVRVDGGATDPTAGGYPYPDLVIAADGTIHVAYTDNRVSGSSTYGSALMYTRSTDGGVTFEPERMLATRGTFPDMTIAADGSILLASTRGARLAVHRSTDGGLTFVEFLTESVTSASFRAPRLEASPSDGTVLLGANTNVTTTNNGQIGPLWLWRSTNNGQSFTTPGQKLTDKAVRPYPPVIRRTPLGRWVVAWTDSRADGYANLLTDVYVASSTTDGASWGASARADGDVAGAASSRVWPKGLVVVPGERIFVAFSDGRDDRDRSLNIYSNASPVAPLNFGPDRRIDTDGAQVNAWQFDPDLATDAASHVYVAFAARAPGPYSDIHVAASGDGGHSFADPVKASPWTAGSRICRVPRILARPDGRVYVLYLHENPSSNLKELRLSRSSDFGRTWSVPDTFVGYAANSFSPSFSSNSMEWDGVQFALGGTGRVHVAWTDMNDVFVSSSGDDGESFTTSDLDGDVGPEYYGPALCVRGDQLVLSFVNTDPVTLVNYYVWGSVSEDGGQTWTPPQRLQSADSNAPTAMTYCAQAPGEQALVTWSDDRSGRMQAYGNRWSGTAWEGDRLILGLGDRGVDTPSAVYSSASHVLVTGNAGQEAWSALSVDGGVTFGSPVRLDDAAPVPDAGSWWPVPVADGQGNIWIFWEDLSGGSQNAEVVRHSSDHGETFGPLYRLSNGQPPGSHLTGGWWMEPPAAALPGVFLMAYRANRTSALEETAVNAWDTRDFDRDLAATTDDCDDADPDVRAVPMNDSSLRMSRIAAGARLAWSSQTATAGNGTRYDIVDGSLAQVSVDRGYARAACLASEQTESAWDDARPPAAPGEALYYLVRARNACGSGGYGDSGLDPDPRDALDASSPCP